MIEITNAPGVFTELTEDGHTLAELFYVEWDVILDGTEAQYIQIQNLHVIPERRGQGLASTLMHYTLANHRHVPVLVRAEAFNIGSTGMSQERLIEWYQRLGFTSDPNPFMEGEGWMWRPALNKASRDE